MDRRVRTLLIGVAGCALLFGLILVLAYGFPAARRLDAKALEGFLGLRRPAIYTLTLDLVKVGDAPAVGVIGLLLTAMALLRAEPRVAAAVVLLLGATSVSSQLLKAVLAYPRFADVGWARVTPAAFPSGHSTAVMALAIACVLVVPPRLRLLAAVVGGGLALAVGIAAVALGWHFPSDVAGGFLLATGWGLAIAAGLRLAALRWPARTVRGRLGLTVRHATETVAGAGLAILAALGALALVGAGVLAVARVHLLDFVKDHTAALLVGAALVLLALGLLAGFVAGLRQRERG